MSSSTRRSIVIGAAALPALAVPALVGTAPFQGGTLPAAAAAAEPDPIFALIEAHRAAYAVYADALKRADEFPLDKHSRETARVIVDHKPDSELIRGSDAEGPFFRWKSLGKKPIYASSPYDIRRAVPEQLDPQAREAWIAERTEELEKEYKRIKSEQSLTEHGKLEAASEEAAANEQDILEELITTIPTTPGGLAALLAYVRSQPSVRDQVFGCGSELSCPNNLYCWTMERIACAAAGLPEPAEHDVGRDNDDDDDC
jgi:hypothetical protein